MEIEYEIEGTITFKIDTYVYGKNEEEALKKIKEELEEYYRLKVIGSYALTDTVKMDIDAFEVF